MAIKGDTLWRPPPRSEGLVIVIVGAAPLFRAAGL